MVELLARLRNVRVRRRGRASGVPLALLLLFAVGCADPDRPRPNVLFLISDDLAPHALGCYGNDLCRTPAIDSLAARGVRFTRAYSQFPGCAPSRASIMSGMYPLAIGVTTNREAKLFSRHLGSRPTLAGLFRDAGWHTARVSKIFHMEIPTDIRAGGHGIDHEPSWSERHSIEAPEWLTPGKKEAMKPWGRLYSRDQYFANVFSIIRADGNGAEQVDALAADKAIEILRQPREEPLFLAVGLVRPHVPLVAPEEYFAPYPPEEMPLAERVENDWDDIPELGISTHADGVGLTDDERRRRVISAYYAAVSFMDAQVGRILRTLDEQGLTEETFVVFTSDHGYHLGEHDLWGKGSLHEESIRVPLIFAGPGIAPSSTDALAQLVDIYPTLTELADLDVPRHVQGRSLLPVLEDPDATVNDDIHAMRSGGNLLRTERWAYLAWLDGTAELYDMENDPRQFTNLAESAEHVEIVRMMRQRLERKHAEIGPAPDAERRARKAKPQS